MWRCPFDLSLACLTLQDSGRVTTTQCSCDFIQHPPREMGITGELLTSGAQSTPTSSLRAGYCSAFPAVMSHLLLSGEEAAVCILK